MPDRCFPRGHRQSQPGQGRTASHTEALEIYRAIGYRRGEAWTLNSLGITQYEIGDYTAATASLTRALELQRQTGNRLGEANTTYELGAVRRLTGDYPAAIAGQQQALALYRDLGYQRGEANVLVELGTVQRLTGDYPAAAAHYEQALEGIGRCYLRDGHPDEAARYLRQALDIYQRIGSPAAERVRQIMGDHGI